MDWVGFLLCMSMKLCIFYRTPSHAGFGRQAAKRLVSQNPSNTNFRFSSRTDKTQHMADTLKFIDILVKYLRGISVPFLFFLTAAFGFVLFLPEDMAKTFALAEFRTEYRVFVGPAFLLALSLLAERMFSIFRQQRKSKQSLKRTQESLHYLTPEEKGYLAVYVAGGQTILYASIDDKVMRGLAMRKITYAPSQTVFLTDGIAYILYPWAKEYLEKNPHLLEDCTIGHDFLLMNQHISKPLGFNKQVQRFNRGEGELR